MTATTQSSAPTPKQERVAVVAVHGIGNQGRYQTLDKMVRGLEDSLGASTTCIDGTRILAGRNFSYVSIERAPELPRFDCYEAYWQHQVRGVTKVQGVLKWIAFSMLAPVRLWSQLDVYHRSRLGRINRLIAELVRLIVLPGTVLVGTILGLWAYINYILRQQSFTKAFGDLELSRLIEGKTLWLLGESMLAFVITVLTFNGVWKALVRPRLAKKSWRRKLTATMKGVLLAPPPRAMHRVESTRSELVWGRASLFFLTLFAGLAAWRLLHTNWQPELVDTIKGYWGFFVATGLAVLAWKVGRVLMSVAGDAAVYLTDDPDSNASKARREISRNVDALISDLLRSEYEQVHIIAHSLGAVITYDVLNSIRTRKVVKVSGSGAGVSEESSPDEVRPVTDVQWEKVGAFVTLACPLDQVAYYFRTRVPNDRSVRMRVLRHRHGLRQRATDTSDEFIDGPQNFKWINLHAWSDPIGTPLKGYKTDYEKSTKSGFFLQAHEGMWKNPEVYDEMVPWLTSSSAS